MAVSDSSKVDLLYKKLFGVTKTDTSTNKGAGNESIASPALVRGDKIWVDAASIPAIAADVTNIVQSYLTTNRIECTADTTTTPVGSVYPTWKTNITDWISPEFGSTYFVKVYAETAGNANPTNGISLSDAGAGNAGEWYFDYQSGVLNFIGGTIPAALTAAKVIYITGYRYIGAVGITSQTNATTATTANVAYAANIANIVLTLSNFTTANLTEGSNQYFTNARVTANLSQQSINVFADVDITGITTNGILSWNGTSFVAGTVGGAATSNVALIAYQADHANTSDNSNVANSVLTISNFTTSNLREGSNLYYTNTRVYSNVIALLPALAGSGIQIQANGQINATASATSGFASTSNVANTVLSISNFTTANLAENINLYYTNSRVLAIVTPYLTTSNVAEGTNLYYTNARVISTVTPYLTTSNVSEGSNLYYTNARVYSNVIALLPSLAGSGIQIQANGQINATASDTSGFASTSNIANIVLSISNFTTANLAEGPNLYYTNARVYSAIVGNLATKANVTDLTTANVTELNNLYYTNARVISAVTPYLTTANVLESSSNLYYTNARVYSAIQSNLATKANVTDLTTANVTELNNLYYTNARVISTITPYLTTANVFESSSNLYYTNARVISAVTPYLTTANVLESSSNLYYTNARVYSAIAGNLAAKANVTDLTTANVTELNNLYYTNARVVSAVTPYLTTANVLELSSNLYYTNARVFANVAQMSINVFADVDMTGLQTSGILIWNGTSFVAGTVSAAASSNVALIAYQADHANTADVSNVANSVLSLTGLTTSNLLEGTNLYFTNARAAIGLTGLNVNVNDLYAAGNLTVQGEFTTLNVATLNIEDKNITLGKGLTSAAQADGAGISIDGAQANITYLVSGDKFNINKNVEILGDIRANTWTGIYSANVIESTNQYFTNTRAVVAITPYLTTANVTEVNNQYFTNARVVANLQLQSINVLADVDISGINNDELLLWNSNDRVFRPSSLTNKLTTANVLELTNLYFTNARVISTLSDGTANLTLYNLTTNGLLTISSGSGAETTTGIEFKNNPAGGTGDTAKIQYYAANIGVNDDTILEISVANNAGDSINLKTTGGGVGVNVARPIAEFDVAGNINARNSLLFSTLVTGPSAVFNNITSNTWNGLYTANVSEVTNLYYTNARVLSIVTPLLTTSNVAEGSNLYYTNARVYANVIGLIGSKANIFDLTTANVVELTNQYFTNARVISAITPYLTTANVTEVDNQYFTNARVYANVIGLLSPKANIVDLTTANVTELNNLYYTNARVISALTPYLTTANVTELTNQYFTNARVYANVIGLLSPKANIVDLTTANVTELTNQYYTNARVFANVSQMSVNVFADVDITGIQTNGILQWNGTSFVAGTISGAATSNVALIAYQADHANTADNSNVANSVLSISNFTTANLAEGSNLYYTNARVLSIVTPLLTTSNVAEGSNLYYTNARVFANVAQMSVNVFADVDITGVLTGYSLVWNGSSFVASAPQGAVDNANIANTVLSISNFTTANLVEGNNLYYTNARVLSALTGNITVGNLKVSTALNYSNTTGVVKVYQYYNEANLSLDTIFL